MNIEKIEKIINKFSEDRDWNKYHSPKNLIMALSAEVGELNEIFQWLSEKESYNLSDNTKKYAKEEVADIAIYLIKI
ncbi:MAG: nucleotide pyrophosphohydrolase, partial [Erysipelotrichia bacterium]|nr:nucleotide pyrophosphohydrolase [Erysipelotrichia bacterium]